MPKGSFECPVCGEDVPAKAKACPHCGACEKSGWNEEESAADGLDLPTEDFDYDKFVAKEFGTSPKIPGMKLLWMVTAILLLILIVAAFLVQIFR